MIAPGQAAHGGARAQKPGLFLPHHLSFSSSNLDGSGLPSIPEDELETEGSQGHRGREQQGAAQA